MDLQHVRRGIHAGCADDRAQSGESTKRLFVDPAARGEYIARIIVKALERETLPVRRLPAHPLSLCMEKQLARCERAPILAGARTIR